MQKRKGRAKEQRRYGFSDSPSSSKDDSSANDEFSVSSSESEGSKADKKPAAKKTSKYSFDHCHLRRLYLLTRSFSHCYDT